MTLSAVPMSRLPADDLPRPGTRARRAALLAEAREVLEARHREPGLGVDDVAHQIATSRRQLQRVFAELGDGTFRDELAAVRMRHAAALLRTTGAPVNRIAREVGYRQAAQFAKAFRRHHGVAPTAFRARARARARAGDQRRSE